MALNKIYLGGEIYSGGGGGAAEISKAEGNVLTQKTDGLYVPASPIEVSAEAGNLIKIKTDGLYVAIDTNDATTKKAIEDIVKENLETENIDFSDF